MTKKYILIPMALLFLSIIFAVISILVILTRGKHDGLLRKKLKVGAIILTLIAAGSFPGMAMVTCYTGPPMNMFRVDFDVYTRLETDDSIMNIEVSLSEHDFMTLDLFYPQSDYYLYSIYDSTDDTRVRVISEGRMEPLDGKLDGEEEKMRIPLADIEPGQYYLTIFAGDNDREYEVYFIGIFLKME